MFDTKVGGGWWCRKEQMLIEVYETDGWRGASREKVKPTAELERAHLQVTPPSLTSERLLFGPDSGRLSMVLQSLPWNASLSRFHVIWEHTFDAGLHAINDPDDSLQTSFQCAHGTSRGTGLKLRRGEG